MATTSSIDRAVAAASEMELVWTLMAIGAVYWLIPEPMRDKLIWGFWALIFAVLVVAVLYAVVTGNIDRVFTGYGPDLPDY